MKDNKLYKVLRIIFLTLAILSMVFSLSKKFVHAESKNNYPVPFGFGSGYGYDLGQSSSGGDSSPAYIPTDDDIANIVSVIETNKNATCYGLFVREFNDDNYSFYYTLTDFAYGMPNNTYPSLGYWGFLNCWCYGTKDSLPVGSVTFIPSTGNIIVDNFNGAFNQVNLFYGDGNSAYAYSDTNIPCYPLWHKDNAPIQVSSSWSADPSTYADGFVYVGNSGGGGFDGPGFTGNATGTLSPSDDFDGQGFNLDFDFSIDLNPLQVLGEEIRDGIGTLKDRVVEGFQVIGGKIDTFKDRVVEGFQTLTSIPSKVSDIYDYITEPFDEEKFSDKFEEMELGQELTTFRTDIESFTGTFNVSPAAAEDVRFSIPFTLPYVNQNLQAVIDFSFYDRIRSIVVPFFTVFLIFGMVWSLIRSIPGILHGTSPDGDS